MPVSVEILKPSYGSCSNGGLSSRASSAMLLLGDEEVTDPAQKASALRIVPGAFRGTANAVPAYPTPAQEKCVGPMMGGCYISGYGEFSREVERITGSRFYGAVPLHDRFETAAQYAALSV